MSVNAKKSIPRVYRARRFSVVAHQYKPGVLIPGVENADAKLIPRSPWILTAGGPHTIHEGDWVVSLPSGSKSVFSATDFDALFTDAQ